MTIASTDLRSDLDKLNQAASQLTLALKKTLALPANEQPFVGNEEKLFLYFLAQYLSRNYQIKEAGCVMMYDIINLGKGGRRPNLEPNTFSSVMRGIKLLAFMALLRAKARSFVNPWQRSFRLYFKLKNRKTLIHYTAHLRGAPFVVHCLTRSAIMFPQRDEQIRARFSEELSDVGMEPKLASALVQLFPISHLESYQLLNKHLLAKLPIDTVCSSIYGIMIDPLLGAIVRRQKSQLIFVQHGGAYGFLPNMVHRLEVEGADQMLWWGVGEKNVFPTRYSAQCTVPVEEKIYIVLSPGVARERISKFIKILHQVEMETGVSGEVVGHPRDRGVSEEITYGIGYEEHESASLVVYDNILHSLIYARVLARRAFLVLDDEQCVPQHENAAKWVELMKGAGVMVGEELLEESLLFWIKRGACLSEEFGEAARAVIGHVLSNPRLEELYGDSWASR